MVRVITQDTYDEVVKENIDEFDMEPEEAMKEAIAQFEAQGVDLSLIIKDLALTPGDKHLVAVTVDKLKELCAGETVEDELILKELEVLRSECEKDLARRIRAGKEGAYDILIKLLEARYKMYQQDKSEKDAAFIVSVLNTLAALMDIQPDLLEIKGIDLINSMLSTVTNEDILVPLLKWTCMCCVRHEMNRQNLFSKDMIENIKRLLDNQKNRKILSGTLHLVRVLTLDDDIRVEFGKAHDHSKELGAQLIDKLAALLKENPSPSLLSDLMLTMSSLLVRNELCAMAADSAETLLAAISDNCGAAATATQGCRLITALAGNDDVKRRLIQSGAAPIVVGLLNLHMSNASTAAIILKCIAALVLREPTHSEQMFASGAPDAILECMNSHADNCAVQKNGCWAIRNMVARCREQNAKFHELGAEAILNNAYGRFEKEFGFDIKAALRDLECDVKLDEQWTGKGVQMEQ